MGPIGFYYDSDYWCHACLPVEGYTECVFPIWREEVVDYPLHCRTCHAFLGGNLTEYGEQRIKNNFLAGHFGDIGKPSDALAEYMIYYNYINWYFIWTFLGPMNPYGIIRS